MLFNSVEFMVFFPVVTLLYFALPHRIRWVWLLVSSYYFYMSWNPKYALLIAISTVITYMSGLLIERSRRKILSGGANGKNWGGGATVGRTQLHIQSLNTVLLQVF